MNALLLAANTNMQTLEDRQIINFGTPVRRYGRNINMSGGNVTANGEGYYLVDATVTGTSVVGGIATLQLYANGVPIPGANASETITAAETFALTVPTGFRIKCCEEVTITANILNVDTVLSNAAIRVVKA